MAADAEPDDAAVAGAVAADADAADAEPDETAVAEEPDRACYAADEVSPSSGAFVVASTGVIDEPVAEAPVPAAAFVVASTGVIDVVSSGEAETDAEPETEPSDADGAPTWAPDTETEPASLSPNQKPRRLPVSRKAPIRRRNPTAKPRVRPSPTTGARRRGTCMGRGGSCGR